MNFDNFDAKVLKKQLLEIMKKDPMSYTHLAKEIGIKSPITIIDFMRGRRTPYIENLIKIANWIEKKLKEHS